jgi:hypothetical protein
MAELKAAWKVAAKAVRMVASKAELTAVDSAAMMVVWKVESSVDWWDCRWAVLLAERRAVWKVALMGALLVALMAVKRADEKVSMTAASLAVSLVVSMAARWDLWAAQMAAQSGYARALTTAVRWVSWAGSKAAHLARW